MRRKCLFGMVSCVLLLRSFGEENSVCAIEVTTGSLVDPVVTYNYIRNPDDQAVLLLIPGHNGKGRAMFTDEWKQFAKVHHLVLMAPTFVTNDSELKNHLGYYYADQWSGRATEEALQELDNRENLTGGKVLIFGFSAGAHFAHRFALWRPELVKAFVAYSAAWWDSPTDRLANVPALIMCGESDPRFDATWEFMSKGLSLNLPWVWRSYIGVGHQMTPSIQKMAEVFLAHYADDIPDKPFYGDVQSYSYVAVDKRDSIPIQERVTLPSKEIADQWRSEP